MTTTNSSHKSFTCVQFNWLAELLNKKLNFLKDKPKGTPYSPSPNEMAILFKKKFPDSFAQKQITNKISNMYNGKKEADGLIKLYDLTAPQGPPPLRPGVQPINLEYEKANLQNAAAANTGAAAAAAANTGADNIDAVKTGAANTNNVAPANNKRTVEEETFFDDEDEEVYVTPPPAKKKPKSISLMDSISECTTDTRASDKNIDDKYKVVRFLKEELTFCQLNYFCPLIERNQVKVSYILMPKLPHYDFESIKYNQADSRIYLRFKCNITRSSFEDVIEPDHYDEFSFQQQKRFSKQIKW